MNKHASVLCVVQRTSQIYQVSNLYRIIYVIFLKLLKPGGHYMYHQFNTQQFYVLPTQCIFIFCVDLRTNSDYFPIQR
jgi:hypothetical protein